MSISAIDFGQPHYTTDTVTDKIMGKEDFLKLLIAQIEYQDPLDPMKDIEFTAQLTQYSQLEQLFNVNDNLQNLEAYQSLVNSAQTVNFIGKNAKVESNFIQLKDDTVNPLYIDLKSNTTQTFVSIYDSNNHLIKTIKMGPLESGEHEVIWDKEDEDGNQMPDGMYYVGVEAHDINGNEVESLISITGDVTGVVYDQGYPYLMIGDQRVSLASVIHVSE
ncbi:MAG: flagellar hook assembly protein FlgD [Thermodesulfobacteriota bacterium]|nr:flagellar hook assembly protein FlgD [Thermodesulfobacteriota bacterium]